jgi:hypothetical protein
MKRRILMALSTAGAIGLAVLMTFPAMTVTNRDPQKGNGHPHGSIPPGLE